MSLYLGAYSRPRQDGNLTEKQICSVNPYPWRRTAAIGTATMVHRRDAEAPRTQKGSSLCFGAWAVNSYLPHRPASDRLRKQATALRRYACAGYHRCRFCTMRLLRRCAILPALSALAWLAIARGGDQAARPPDDSQRDITLPSGKSQRDEILKAERDENIKDAAQLVELAQQLQQDLEKNDRFVLSLSTLKKTDEIEKLARKIRSRMRHN